jgi:DNA (cytosine-5)-methyltransferase 1
MKYLSVCSGIEAASKAWEPIGWEPVAFSEIEPFPAAVLKHHWPKVQNLGDMTKYEQWNIQSGTIDLLVGGTPCQSFSVAGLRQGLKDPRGNLMLTYLAIAERFKPRWLVWENVPGVLSSNGGKDFGSFLGALGELGYVDWAYRILDAQWFGVAQRRRRVFVVAHLGKGNLAAKVLFESESVCRDTPPSRETRQGVATNVAPSLTASNDPSRSPQSSEVTQQVNAVLEAINAGIPDVCATIDCGLSKQVGKQLTQQAESFYFPIPIHDQALYENHPNDSRVTGPHDVAPSCVSRYGTGGGNVPLVQEAIAFPATMSATQCAKTKNLSPAICSVNQTAIAFEPGIATREGNDSRFVKELSPTLRKEMGDNQVAVAFPIDTQNMTEGHASGGKGHGNNGDPSFTLTKGHSHAVAVDVYNQAIDGNTAATLTSACGGTNTSGPKAMQSMAVRRLSPRECERLQGFPDDHTMIPWRNKPADQCPDGPRYKALGNSMAVPCMAWIGKRIDAVERNMK